VTNNRIYFVFDTAMHNTIVVFKIDGSIGNTEAVKSTVKPFANDFRPNTLGRFEQP
jgi:hypothetical protein